MCFSQSAMPAITAALLVSRSSVLGAGFLLKYRRTHAATVSCMNKSARSSGCITKTKRTNKQKRKTILRLCKTQEVHECDWCLLWLFFLFFESSARPPRSIWSQAWAQHPCSYNLKRNWKPTGQLVSNYFFKLEECPTPSSNSHKNTHALFQPVFGSVGGL